MTLRIQQEVAQMLNKSEATPGSKSQEKPN